MSAENEKEKKRYRGSVTFEGKKYYVQGFSKEEVQEARERKLRELEEGIVDPKRMTVRQWTEEWLRRYKKGKVNDRWLKDMQNNLEKYLLYKIGAYQMSKVKQYHIQEVLDQLEGKSQSLINKTYDQISNIFYKAWINSYIPKNPAVDLQMPKSAEQKKRRALTDDERALVLSTAKTFKGGLFFLIMLKAGLRNSEVAALQWKNVDLDNNVIHVRQMLKSDGTIESYGKTENAERDVLISEDLKNDFLKAKSASKPKKDDYVVPQRNSSKHQTRNSMRKLWLDFRKEMHKNLGGETTKTVKTYKRQESGRKYERGVEEIIDDKVAKDLVPYCFRHTFCTDLKAAGIPVDVAKDIMGHSSITITADIYSHAESNSLNEAKAKMDKLNKNK